MFGNLKEKMIMKNAKMVAKVLRNGVIDALEEPREEDIEAIEEYFKSQALSDVKQSLKDAGILG